MKKDRNFPFNLLALAKKCLKEIGFFSVETPKSKNSHVRIQRGVMRTNCIDSLDRTNFAQEMFGYLAMTEMLERLKICDNDKIQIKSQFFQLVFEMYNKMGDTIS